MTDKIGFLWQDGEKLAAAGSIHEALLQFQRAKTLLILESQCFFSNGEQKQNRIPPVYGEIMTKLTRSIDKNVTLLHNHPVFTLGVSKNYTHKEIKKAYRIGALKYHPDKNKDCDSSCVFTALQAAYEILLATAAKDHKENPIKTRDSRPASSRQTTQQQQRPPPQRTTSNSNNNHSKPTHTSAPRKTPMNTDNLYKAARNRDASIASIVSMMTTAELRKVLSKFGFSNLETASREELVKKYLALHTHFGKADPAPSSKQHQAPHENWAEQMRSEMDNARRKEMNKGAPPKRSASMNDSRHSSADEVRTNRVDRLKKELPKMSLSELRRMMHTCDISLTGCIEKYDLLEKLCEYYGIAVDELVLTSSETAAAAAAAAAETPPRAEESKGVPREQPKESESHKEHVYSSNSNSSKQRSENVFGKSESSPPQPAAPSASNKHDYLWTKERLRDMEAKLHRNSRRRKSDRPRKPQSPPAEEEDVVPPCMQQFMDGHAEIFKEVRTAQSVEAENPFNEYRRTSAPTAAPVCAPTVTPGRRLLDEDSDSFSDDSEHSSDSGIQWRPEKTSEKYAHVHIPAMPLGGYVSEGSMSEEDIFDDPTLLPSQLKNMRFQKASAQRDVNVGVSLLSDDNSSDDEDLSSSYFMKYKPQQPFAGNSSPMSATAWSGIFQR